MDTEITYESISEKLGFRPFIDDYEIQVNDYEDDSLFNPFSILTLEESIFLSDWLEKNRKITNQITGFNH